MPISITTMQTTLVAKQAWRRRRAELLRRVLAPPPRLTISEWADRYRMLSREASAEPGKWSTARAPYLRGIMDACSDPLIEHVVIMKAAQIGGTEIINNIVGYYIDQDPAPILVLQPTLDQAKSWSTDRLAPMLRDTPRLKGKVKDPRSRDSGNTMLHKAFAGGHLTIVGANSASGLAARPIRIVLGDEEDRYPASAGTEGDPITLAAQRTATFWNRKLVENSTPTIKGFSRIEKSFAASDQRFYHVACPECAHRQVLRWAQLKWEIGKPETAAYCCEACGVLIDESQKQRLLERGEWIPKEPTHRSAGFHISALYSPWVRWETLVEKFFSAKDNPEKLKVFVNTVLGEVWEEDGDYVPSHKLADRQEDFGGEVPDGVGLLTAAVDVQGDRLEWAVWGWGAEEESWIIDTDIIPGDPGTVVPWQLLERDLIARRFKHVAGVELRPMVTFIDSGGHHAKEVYQFCRAHLRSRVFAIKGAAMAGAPLVGKPSRNNSAKTILYTLGVSTAKDTLMSRLRIVSPGPGYVHLPLSLDKEHLEQLTSEKVVTRYVHGRPVRTWVAMRPRNEQLDLAVYNMAALHSLGPVAVRNLATAAAKLTAMRPAEGDDGTEKAPDPATPARRRRAGWVNGWR
jgi:phage terminase large subunit GpA-like protein